MLNLDDHTISIRIFIGDSHKFLLIHCRINPQNEAAKKGLERLEKQMKVFLQVLCFSAFSFYDT